MHVSAKEQNVLVAYDPARLARAAAAFDAFVAGGNGHELISTVRRGRTPVPKRRRDAAASTLRSYQSQGAPAPILRAYEYESDPKLHICRRVDAGDRTLRFEELTPFIEADRVLVWRVGVVWALTPNRDVEVALSGSTRCVVDGARRFPHWREEVLDADAQQLARERLGGRWNANYHQRDGVERARDVFAEARPRDALERAADCPPVRFRMLLAETPIDPRPFAVDALAIVSKQLPRLGRFFDTAAARGRHVLSRPRDL